ncbi:MAG: hypothetical protein ACI8Y4_004928 [Candidatus Poriferisodalaceae bacterium]|jgi:hypothetical protein
MLHQSASDHPWRLSASSANRRWRHRFESVTNRHVDLALLDRPDLTSRCEDALLRSLAVFQLGESGDGSHLLACAREAADDDYLRAAELFVQEEQQHAEMLAGILETFDQPLLTDHWSHRVFKTARRGSGLRVELLVLLLAEVVGVCYYEVLRDGLDDDGLSLIFAAIAADEFRHLDFHGETMPQFLEEWPPVVYWGARIGWNAAVRGASLVAAWSHRHILRECGVSARQFVGACLATVQEHEPRLFRRGLNARQSLQLAA